VKTTPDLYNLKDDENHWCPVPNEIVDQLCMTYLTTYESRVVWAVIRKTFGFHKPGSKHLRKKTDGIALSQFVEMTGIDRRNVRRVLSRLTERQIMLCVDRGAGTTKTYGLNLLISQWVLGAIEPPRKKRKKRSKVPTGRGRMRRR
jgi:phage replication O-like protein O